MHRNRSLSRIGLFTAGAMLFSVSLQAQGNGQAAGPSPTAQLSEAQYVELGRKYTEWFVTGMVDSLLANTPPEDRTPEQAETYLRRRDFVAVQNGSEQVVLEEKMNRRRGRPQYWRESRYDHYTAEPIVLRWVFDEQGRIKGLGLGPKSQTPAPD